LKLEDPLSPVVEATNEIPTVNNDNPVMAVTIEVSSSLKKSRPQIKEMRIPVPIHTGADLDSPEFFTAKTEKMLPEAHKMPDRIPKYENTNELDRKAIITLEAKMATHIIAWK
jgi:hypothetical protein